MYVSYAGYWLHQLDFSQRGPGERQDMMENNETKGYDGEQWDQGGWEEKGNHNNVCHPHHHPS